MTSPSTDRRYGANSGLAFKAPVRLATTANITLSGNQSIDGTTTASDDRVLVKNQSDGTQNGIYMADSGTWTRAPDFDGNRDIAQGTQVYVTGGSANINTIWVVSTLNPITIDTTSITFSQSPLSPTGTLSVGSGGTGRTSDTAYAIIAGGTTSTGAQQSLAVGALTEILVGGGASALPVWTTATGTGAPVRAGSPTVTGTFHAADVITTGNAAISGGAVPAAGTYASGLAVGTGAVYAGHAAANVARASIRTNIDLNDKYIATTTQPVGMISLSNGDIEISSYAAGAAGGSIATKVTQMTISAAGAVVIPQTLTVTGTTTHVDTVTLQGAIVGPVTATVFNTVSTTVNAFGAAQTINMGVGGGGGVCTIANATLSAKAILGTSLTFFNTTSNKISMAGSTTNAAYIGAVNTGGTFYAGVDNSAGGGVLSSNGAYAAVVGTSGATALHLDTNTVSRLLISSAGVITIPGQTVLGASSATLNYVKHQLTTTITSGGASNYAAGILVDGTVTGFAGDILSLSVLGITPTGIVTQGNTDTIGVVASQILQEPVITVGTGDTISVAATLYVTSAPTEGSVNAALYVASGASILAGNTRVGGTTAPTVAMDVTGAIASTTTITAGTSIVATTGFGCNSKSAQTAFASGGALNAYGAGANGLDSGANMSALHAMVVAIRAALVANGIMS